MVKILWSTTEHFPDTTLLFRTTSVWVPCIPMIFRWYSVHSDDIPGVYRWPSGLRLPTQFGQNIKQVQYFRRVPPCFTERIRIYKVRNPFEFRSTRTAHFSTRNENGMTIRTGVTGPLHEHLPLFQLYKDITSQIYFITTNYNYTALAFWDK
jgi:hypothetical protein